MTATVPTTIRLAATAAAALLLTGCGGTARPATSSTPAGAPTWTTGPAAQTTLATLATPAGRVRPRIQVLPYRLPQALSREAVAPLSGSRVVIAGGLLPGDHSLADAYGLDLATGRLTRRPALPVAVHDTAGTTIAGTTFVVGGGNASEQSVVQASTGAGWKIVGHLPQARSDLTVVGAGGGMLALGGYNGSRPAEPDILASTDGRAWHTIGHLPVPVRYAASAVADGSVWLFGGEVGGVMQTAVQRIDPTTGKAQVVAHLPVRIGHTMAMPFGSRILLVGGRSDPNTPLSTMWWFDPASGRFTAAGRLPMPLADAGVAEVGSTAYLIGGESPAMTDRVLQVSAGN